MLEITDKKYQESSIKYQVSRFDNLVISY